MGVMGTCGAQGAPPVTWDTLMLLAWGPSVTLWLSLSPGSLQVSGWGPSCRAAWLGSTVALAPVVVTSEHRNAARRLVWNVK